MKIGIVSDTHRNIEYLKSVAGYLVNRQKVSPCIIWATIDDVKELDELYLEIVQVPGIYDHRYKSGKLAAKVFETILGLNILLVHSFEKDVQEDDIARSDIILFGHTHHYELRLEDGRLYMNPGHLKGPMEKNMPPTFGMLTIMDREVIATIYSIQFKPVQTLELLRSEGGLYKAI